MDIYDVIRLMKIFKPNEFATMLEISIKTLQDWNNSGKLKAFRSPTNRRYYTQEQYEAYMGIQRNVNTRKVVIYARVSSRTQKDDLENQKDFLQQYANAKGIQHYSCIFFSYI